MHGEACEEESKRAYKGTQASDGEQTTKPGTKLTRFTPIRCFARVLEEKGLEWHKDWKGLGGSMPYNGITKAGYKGCNAFWLSLVSMMKGYNDPRWVTMKQIMDNENRYHTGEKWHLKKGSKATYVEYWYPYDITNNKALTWPQYREALAEGRTEKEDCD